ncbi:MAG: UDP-N-acetylmuramate dehydrogenase [Halanaerobiales bacterium]
MSEKKIKVLDKIEELEVKYNVSIKEYTSFKIGGPVDIFAVPHSITALQKLLKAISKNNLDFFILGKGSNIIVGDRGYRGIVIYTGELKKVNLEKDTLTAEAGITLASLANKALASGLTGLEFASGIPGTLGGALFMNAGAYGGEMKDVIENALLLDYSGNELELNNKQLKFSYRYSVLQEKKLIAVRVNMKLKAGSKSEIKEKMKMLNRKRKEKQPLEWPSAGSIFKRPTGYYSGPLIENAGLKGLRVGDAQISTKHAGFIINLGNATAADVKELIKKVQEVVYQENGVKLEVEPRFIGEF